MPPTRVPKGDGPTLPERLTPRKKPRQERSRALVDALVEAGSRVLSARGFRALSMKEVALRAGVSPGSLYQYFPDRAALVAEVVERLSERERAFHLERMATLSHDAGLDEVLEALIRSAVAFQAREGALMREALRAMPHLGRHHLLVERVRLVADGLGALIAARAPHLSPRELELTVHVLVNTLHSLTHDGVLPRPAWLDDESLTRAMLGVAKGYLGGVLERGPTSTPERGARG